MELLIRKTRHRSTDYRRRDTLSYVMATLTKSIAWNTLLQIIGRTAGTILGLLSVAILTRYLGQSGYGAFTTITGFLQFFGILVDMGLTLTAVQMIAAPGADERRIMGNIFTVRLISAVIFFGLAPIVILFFPYPAEVKAGVAIGSLAFLGMTQSQVLVGVFQKYLRMSRAAVAEVAGRAVLLIGISIATYFHWGLLSMVWALVAGNAVQLALACAFAQRLVPFRLVLEWPVIRDVLRRSWPIGLSIAFNLIYLKGDVIILSLFRSQAEVGLYGAAYKVLDVVTVIPMMFMGLVLPILVEAWRSGDHESFRRRMQKAFDFSTLLALPMAGGAIVLGRDIMTLVAGREFRLSGDLLAILILAALAVFYSGLYGHTIVAIGKQRRAIWGYAIDAALALVAYLIFVPRYGAPAAAWITVFSEIFIALYTFTLVLRVTRVLPSLITTLKVVLATILMVLVLIALPRIHVLFMVVIGAAVYTGLVVLLRAVSRETLGELTSSSQIQKT